MSDKPWIDPANCGSGCGGAGEDCGSPECYPDGRKPTFEAKHCATDLREMIRLLEERQQRNIDAVRGMDRELTPVENARFEVGFGLLSDLLRDLRQMADGWEQGQPNYRVTEKALELLPEVQAILG